jgi:hypothetical protein
MSQLVSVSYSSLALNRLEVDSLIFVCSPKTYMYTLHIADHYFLLISSVFFIGVFFAFCHNLVFNLFSLSICLQFSKIFPQLSRLLQYFSDLHCVVNLIFFHLFILDIYIVSPTFWCVKAEYRVPLESQQGGGGAESQQDHQGGGGDHGRLPGPYRRGGGLEAGEGRPRGDGE